MALFCQFCRLNQLSTTYFVRNLRKLSYSCNLNVCASNILNPTALSLTRTLSRSRALRLLLTATHRSGYCYQTMRMFSSDRDGSTPSIKGTVVTIPNPFSWVKNKLANIYIKNSVDPQFSMDEFKIGAIQV